MTDHSAAHADAFNLLCGDKLGEGIHRMVFACRLRPELVVKVETGGDWRYFANVHEMKFWDDNRHAPGVAAWLAPCEYMSPDGRLLLQRRVRVCTDTDKMPETVPAFLADLKRENFGWLDDKLVAIDYAATITSASTRQKKVTW